MGNLIKAEFFILFKSLGFKILLFFSFITGGLIKVINLGNIITIKTTGFDAIIACWQVPFYNAVFGGTLAAFFICGGFKRNTYGVSLSSGNTRLKIFFAKYIVSFAGMFLLSVMISVIPAIDMVINGNKGISLDNGAGYILMRLLYSLAGFMAQYTVIIFLAIAIKNGIVANPAGICFTYVLMVIKANMRFSEKPAIEKYIKYTYIYQSEVFMLCEDGFSGWLYMAVMVLTFIAALALSVWIFERREL